MGFMSDTRETTMSRPAFLLLIAILGMVVCPCRRLAGAPQELRQEEELLQTIKICAKIIVDWSR